MNTLFTFILGVLIEWLADEDSLLQPARDLARRNKEKL